jgi:hypothetical protein
MLASSRSPLLTSGACAVTLPSLMVASMPRERKPRELGDHDRQ